MKEIIELNKQGFTNKQITVKLNLESTVVSNYLNRRKIKTNRFQVFEKEPNLLKQLILGSVLGDGYLTIVSGSNKNSRLHWGHGGKQKEYLQWKLDLLSKYELNSPSGIRKYVDISDRYKKGYNVCYYGRSLFHPIFTKYRDVFYNKDRKKVIPDNSLSELDSFGLAIWYMDDGNVTSSSYQLNTQGFKESELFYLQQVLLDKFDLRTSITSVGVIYITTRSSDLFIYLIKPYIIPLMEYKLIRYYDRVLYKQGELLETPEVDNQQPSLGRDAFEGSTTSK